MPNRSNEILKQNKQSWDNMADSWFGSTALPVYGCLVPTEDELSLFPDLRGAKVLDVGCGSGHSLKYCGDKGASELWGIDMSTRQIENAEKHLTECGYKPNLLNQPMEDFQNIPKDYFDVVYAIYSLGWTVDLSKTIHNISTALKSGGTLIFSWDHPLMSSITEENERLIFKSYISDEEFSYVQRGNPVTVHNRRMSTWINTLAEEGFKIVKLVEETAKDILEREYEFSSGYYSPSRAQKMPLSFIIKAVKQ